MKTTPKPVHYVEIGGENRPVRFGMLALSTYGELCDLDLQEVQQKFAPPDHLTEAQKKKWQPRVMGYDLMKLIYAGCYDGALKEGRPRPDFPWEEVGFWIDDLPDGSTAVADVFAAFADGQGKAEPGAPGKPKPPKKME